MGRPRERQRRECRERDSGESAERERAEREQRERAEREQRERFAVAYEAMSDRWNAFYPPRHHHRPLPSPAFPRYVNCVSFAPNGSVCLAVSNKNVHFLDGETGAVRVGAVRMCVCVYACVVWCVCERVRVC